MKKRGGEAVQMTVCVCVCVCVCIYIYIERERERVSERKKEREKERKKESEGARERELTRMNSSLSCSDTPSMFLASRKTVPMISIGAYPRDQSSVRPGAASICMHACKEQEE